VIPPESNASHDELHDAPQAAAAQLLSEQRRRILMLFAQAKNPGQVAKDLRITLSALGNHRYAINQKLRTHNRLEAVLHAMKRD
jgi:DNA-binding NarL/FixJ family response regulator